MDQNKIKAGRWAMVQYDDGDLEMIIIDVDRDFNQCRVFDPRTGSDENIRRIDTVELDRIESVGQHVYERFAQD